MADYTQILDQLDDTESFFQREKKPYKDFRNALTNLNNEMRAVGNRVLSAGEVQHLREVTAKAKEAWDIYFGQMEAVLLEVANQDIPADQEGHIDRLSELDRRRLTILNGMTGLLQGDLDALRNYDPTRGLNLTQIILENRGLTADIRGKNPERVGNAMNTRLVLEVNGRKGAFTEDYTPTDPKDVREAYIEKYPWLQNLIENMADDPEYNDRFDSALFDSPEDLAERILKKDNPFINSAVQMIVTMIPGWGLEFPQELRREDGKVWMENPEFVRQLSEVIHDVCHARDSMLGPSVAGYGKDKNVPRRNAAMSAVADRLGMTNLLARSKVMKVKTDGGDKTGVFMEWAEGKDLKKLTDSEKIDPDIMGKKIRFDSGRAIKSAANLQVLDFICGNVDRHNGNMFYQFEEIDDVLTLVGLQGIDNDASFGVKDVSKGEGKLAGLDSMRLMTRSAAETVLNLTEEELKYSLYGLVEEEEIRHAWKRTKLLQDKIKASMKVKWKNDTDVRPGAIRILDDESPVWDKFTFRELQTNQRIREEGGVFSFVSTEINSFKRMEKKYGIGYQDNTRQGVRENYYKETEDSTVFGSLKTVEYPVDYNNLDDAAIFSLYRNRRTLHEDPASIQAAAAGFKRLMDSSAISAPRGKINEEMGLLEYEDRIFIDGLKASEYVKKYSPENAGNKDYVKAQIMAALTSGRHHVDMVMLRTDSYGHFKADAFELTMDLSRLDGRQGWGWVKSSREERRQSLVKDEDARLERQKAIEEAMVKRAEAHANQKVEELIAQDPVRAEVFRTIPYQELYRKQPQEVEKILDARIDSREKARLETFVKKKAFQQIKNAIDGEPAPAPNIQAPAENGQAPAGNIQAPAENGQAPVENRRGERKRVPMSMEGLNEGLNVDMPRNRRRPQAPANHQGNRPPQNQANQAGVNQVGPQGNQPQPAEVEQNNENRIRRSESFSAGNRRK